MKEIEAELSPATAESDVGALGAIAATAVVDCEVPTTLPVPLVAVTTERMNLAASISVRTKVEEVAPEIVVHVLVSVAEVHRCQV